MKEFQPNTEQAQSFLNLLGHDEEFTFQTFDDRKENRSLARVFHGTFQQYAETLISLNKKGAGIYVMVNRGDGVVHPGQKTCRLKINVIGIRALFADADGIPIEPILKICPPPHILVESSKGKWHIYWLTHDTKLDEFTDRQVAIAECLGTDPAVKDLPRVMRIPGFFHHKQEPFMSRLVTN